MPHFSPLWNCDITTHNSIGIIRRHCCHGCFTYSITNHHHHHITHLLIGWAVWDREFLIDQSAPRLANKNRVRESSGRCVRWVVEMSMSESWWVFEGQRSIESSLSKRFVLFQDSVLCSFHTTAPRTWTPSRQVLILACTRSGLVLILYPAVLDLDQYSYHAVLDLD